MKRVFLPFDLDVFKGINSNHPLPVSLTLPHYDGIEFVRRGPEPGPADIGVATLRDATAFAELLRRRTSGPPLTDEAIILFVLSRQLLSQVRFDTAADLAFLHTTPMVLNQMPYLLHVETITTLFHPFVIQGDNERTELYKQPAYWLTRAMLESNRCRGIFTNLRHTKAQIDRVFASETISGKTTHIPAGPYFTPEYEAKIATGLARKRDKKEVEILFTNSWAQHTSAFYVRGGLGLVLAFLHIEKQFPNVRLILRTNWPPEGIENADLSKVVRDHPKITILPDMLSEEEILDLFIRADIFFLDSESIHSVSLLRAMYCGAACVLSDAPGYDEHVTHLESGIIVPGRREKIYSEDPESGWLRCNFNSMYDVRGERVGQLANVLHGLCMNRDARLAMGINARNSIIRKNSFSGWRDGFEAAMRVALAAPDEPMPDVFPAQVHPR